VDKKMKKKLLILIISFFVLLIFSGTAFGGFWSKGKSTIAWSLPKIEEEQFLGTAKAIVVKFVSKKDLENVQIWITPELEDFLTVIPESFDKINRNEIIQIEIIASIPLNTSIGSYDGTIHLKALKQKGKNKVSKTFAKPLPISLEIKEPTAEDIPFDEVSLPTLERIYEDEETGSVYVGDEVVIRFEENVSETRIKEIISSINGSILGYISDIEIYQVLVPVADPSELEPIIQQLEIYSEVIIATYHWMDKID